ncbi:MAG: protein kinase [Myxococcales bacterium]|nr:protein kinase [Myxococcales bacterium]
MSTSSTNDGHPSVPGWEILEKLGEGGMCAVYRARPDDAEPVRTWERALKVLLDTTPLAAERFAAEAQLLSRIEHPNVVRVHALHEGPPPWLVMDLLVGHDLHEHMDRHGPMDPERAARLFADLASGLAAVHAEGVRHRDLKPANVLLGDDGVPRLIDFGIARDVASPHVTRNGYVVGTAAYLPPEVFTDDDTRQAQDGAKADVYALGQTLYEMLIGRPFHDLPLAGAEAEPMARVMHRKLAVPHLDPRSDVLRIPDGLAEVVIRATRRQRAVRTPSAARLEEELRTWLVQRDSTGEPAPVSVVNRVPPRPALQTARGAAEPADQPEDTAPEPTPQGRPAVAGAVGLVGMGAVALALAAVTALGVALLWIYKPASPHVDTVLAAIHLRSAELGNCPGAGGKGTIQVAVTVTAGKPTRVRVVESTMEARTERCVRRILQAAPFDAALQPYTVQVPVTFD